MNHLSLARPLVALVAVIALAAAGCGSKPDLGAAREQAFALAAQYAPQAKAIAARVDVLIVKLKTLPADLPGVAETLARMEQHRAALAGVQTTIKAIPDQATAAMKGGDGKGLAALIHRTTEETGATILTIGTDVANAELTVSDLETKAKLAPPPATPPAPVTPAPVTP